LNALRRSGASLAIGEPVREIRTMAEGTFCVATPGRTLSAARVILTSGGQSYPGSGTTGDGYGFASALGHSIVSPRPALVPVTVTAPWVPELRGVTLPDVSVSILEGDK